MATTPAAEISVIGGIVAFPKETKDALDFLKPEMFTNEQLANIFLACQKLNRMGKASDITMVESVIGTGQRTVLVGCVEQMPSLAGFKDYCAIVFGNWRKREIKKKLQELAFADFSVKNLMAQLENILSEQRAIERGLNDNTSVDFWGGVMKYLDTLVSPNTAIKTGWLAFDSCTGGLQRKGFYIISGRSGKGKTDFALALATNMSLKCRVSYFSMEMPVAQLMERVVSRLARIEANKLRDKNVTPDEMKRISNAMSLRKEKTKIIIDESQRISVAAVESKIIRHQPDVVFIDHVGLMAHAQKKQAWESVADTSQRLKELAMKYDIVIVGLAQENRDGDSGKPQMGNLKGSDNLSNDADGIFQMHIENPPEFISGNAWIDAEIHVTKNRYGGTGKLSYNWQPQYHDWRPVERNR